MNMVIIPRETTLRYFLSWIKQNYRLSKFKSQWRAVNVHNKTSVSNIFPIDKVRIGKETYGDIRALSFGGSIEGLEIGSYCSIGGDVTFILGGIHPVKNLSTYPFTRHIYKLPTTPDNATKGKIIVGDDVWIGHGVIITSGVHIGQGAVIGAGSVVTKDVPPYAIWLGYSVKKYRFSDSVIHKLLDIDFGNLTQEQLNKFREYCTQEINDDNIEELNFMFEDKHHG